MSHFDLTARRYKIQELTAKTLEESFWNDPQKAQVVIRQLNAIKDVVDSYDALQKALSSLDETQELLKEDFDEEIFELFELEYQEMEKNFADFEIKVLLSHEYDHSSAGGGQHHQRHYLRQGHGVHVGPGYQDCTDVRH